LRGKEKFECQNAEGKREAPESVSKLVRFKVSFKVKLAYVEYDSHTLAAL